MSIQSLVERIKEIHRLLEQARRKIGLVLDHPEYKQLIVQGFGSGPTTYIIYNGRKSITRVQQQLILFILAVEKYANRTNPYAEAIAYARLQETGDININVLSELTTECDRVGISLADFVYILTQVVNEQSSTRKATESPQQETEES